jgi:hypothetical protein
VELSQSLRKLLLVMWLQYCLVQSL